jgi:hypothetical protein
MNFYGRLLQESLMSEAPKPKAKTYAQARADILDHLRSKGWTVRSELTVPWAEDKDRKTRLWFKAQAVWMAHNSKGGVSKDIGAAHSMHLDDLRKEDGPSFLRHVEQWEKIKSKSGSALDDWNRIKDEKDEGISARRATLTEAREMNGKVMGSNCRLQWDRNHFYLDEMPQKGKRKLRAAYIEMAALRYGSVTIRADGFIPENLLRDAKIPSGKTSDGYDALKEKILKAIKAAVVKFVETYGEKDWSWLEHVAWSEREVNSLHVEPEGHGPMQIEAKDFTVQAEYTKFKAYSPNSNMDLSDPHYTYYEASSPTAGRKLYMLLREDPKLLKGVSWNAFGDWLTKNKIDYKTRFSQWH